MDGLFLVWDYCSRGSFPPTRDVSPSQVVSAFQKFNQMVFKSMIWTPTRVLGCKMVQVRSSSGLEPQEPAGAGTTEPSLPQTRGFLSVDRLLNPLASGPSQFGAGAF